MWTSSMHIAPEGVEGVGEVIHYIRKTINGHHCQSKKGSIDSSKKTMEVTIDSKIRLIDSPLGNLSAEFTHQLIKGRSVKHTLPMCTLSE